MIDPQTKGKDISIMIWGAIWIGGRSDLVVMERDSNSPKNGYTANSYLKVLDDQLSDDWLEEMHFVQDNAPIHTAKSVKDWFSNHRINVVEWPPYSPDLNPIEHVWAYLKEQLLLRYPHLVDLGRSEEAIEEFKEAIKETWKALDQEKIDNYIRSMTTRINAVLLAEGWYTRF